MSCSLQFINESLSFLVQYTSPPFVYYIFITIYKYSTNPRICFECNAEIDRNFFQWARQVFVHFFRTNCFLIFDRENFPSGRTSWKLQSIKISVLKDSNSNNESRNKRKKWWHTIANGKASVWIRNKMKKKKKNRLAPGLDVVKSPEWNGVSFFHVRMTVNARPRLWSFPSRLYSVIAKQGRRYHSDIEHIYILH